MKKIIYVRDINRDRLDVNDWFIVTKKGMFSSKNNKKYINVELRDKSGTIIGKVWDRADDFDSLFDRYDLVFVRAKADLYQGRYQLNIADIRKTDIELSVSSIADFYPESPAGIEILKMEYFKIVNEIKEPHIASLFAVINKDKDLLEKFFTFPASIGVHHMYSGGLLEHSLSLAKLAKQTTGVIGGDLDILIAGALLHDIGKIEEMEIRGGFRYSDRGRLLGHITIGVIILERLMGQVSGFPSWLADTLTHIVVSHHGVEEWGSPKKPMSVEALMVHYLDNLDAKVAGVREYMQENMEDEKWSGYHRLYESRFYKIPER